jgi:hypothetical protein
LAIEESGRGGLRRGGAVFFLRTGDSIVAVRRDPQFGHARLQPEMVQFEIEDPTR